MNISVNELPHGRGRAADDRRARRAAGQRQGVLGMLRRLARSLVAAQRRRNTINELSRLDDRQLADIGVRRGDIPRVVDGLMGRGL